MYKRQLYNAAVYLAALPGGWVADRLIGAQRAVMIGGLAITLGNTLLATSSTPKGFYLGLVVIVLGVGLLKPNVSAIVAGLYPEGGARLDSGFTVFYIGINLGAFLGPLVIPLAQSYFGLRAGFGVGAIFMAIGLLQFHFTRKYLGEAGIHSAPIHAAGSTALVPRRKEWVRLWIGVAVAAALVAAVSAGIIPVDPVSLARAGTYVIVGMAVPVSYTHLDVYKRQGQRRSGYTVAGKLIPRPNTHRPAAVQCHNAVSVSLMP